MRCHFIFSHKVWFEHRSSQQKTKKNKKKTNDTLRTGISSSLWATSRGSPAKVFSRSFPKIFTPWDVDTSLCFSYWLWTQRERKPGASEDIDMITDSIYGLRGIKSEPTHSIYSTPSIYTLPSIQIFTHTWICSWEKSYYRFRK